MKKKLFLVLVFAGIVFSVHAQWGWLGDMLDEAIGDDSYSSYYSLRSGTYYANITNGTLRMELSLGNQTARVYDNSDGEYYAGGTAVVSGNVLIIQWADGVIIGTETFTVTSDTSFVSNNDGTSFYRR